jgi:two-component system, NarL family, sensor histidine kinase UhpB
MQNLLDPYRAILAGLPAPMWWINPSGGCDYVNRAWLELTGRTEQQELGNGWIEGIHPDDRTAHLSAYQAAAGARQPFEHEFRLRSCDQSYRWILATAHPLYLGDAFSGYIGLCRDLTECRTAKDALTASRTELRELVAQLQAEREQEKFSLARMLHDDLAGALTALKMNAILLSHRLPSGDQVASETLQSMHDTIDRALSVVRRTTGELHPTVLDDLGLIPALRWQATEFTKRTNIECELDLNVDAIALKDHAALTAFRIMQEALMLFSAWSQPRRVKISVDEQGEGYRFCLESDAVAFSKEAGASVRHLTVGMAERARSVGGELSIESQPGKGSTVIASIPRSPPQIATE